MHTESSLGENWPLMRSLWSFVCSSSVCPIQNLPIILQYSGHFRPLSSPYTFDQIIYLYSANVIVHYCNPFRHILYCTVTKQFTDNTKWLCKHRDCWMELGVRQASHMQCLGHAAIFGVANNVSDVSYLSVSKLCASNLWQVTWLNHHSFEFDNPFLRSMNGYRKHMDMGFLWA